MVAAGDYRLFVAGPKHPPEPNQPSTTSLRAPRPSTLSNFYCRSLSCRLLARLQPLHTHQASRQQVGYDLSRDIQHRAIEEHVKLYHDGVGVPLAISGACASATRAVRRTKAYLLHTLVIHERAHPSNHKRQIEARAAGSSSSMQRLRSGAAA